MNTSVLKSFAPAVRRQLIEAVGRKLDFVLTGDTADLRTAAGQVAELRRQSDQGRAALIDRVTYTWFNRLAALRFLDARAWHPFRARVLTPATAVETQPELLKLTRTGALPPELARFTNPARLNDLLDGRLPSPDPQGEVYRLLVLAACRFYHHLMPFLFETLDDETELLLPDDLLTEHSVAHGFRTEISDADCAEVEILGWLYQFYISERKDQVMARKSAVPTEDIPAVTQLFTPHWIVRYLVENSLGRLWLLNRPSSHLREHMPYYIEGEAETDFLKITKPQEIRVLDLGCGSGHMLTYAFDLLCRIYEEEGHGPDEIPALILQHNLYGLEICPRAAQLAQFALICKAREQSRAAFRSPVQPQVMCLQDLRFGEDELRHYIQKLDVGDLLNEPVLRFLHQFEDASTFGSLIQPFLEGEQIVALRRVIEAKDLGSQLFLQETHRKVLRVLDQAEMLCQRYHVVVANPPYMGNGAMNSLLLDYAKRSFPQSKTDLGVVFVDRALALAFSGGRVAMVNQHTWLFLGSYTDLRIRLLSTTHISTVLHLGPRAFPEITGEVVQSVAFVIKTRPQGARSHFVRLIDLPTTQEKERNLHTPERTYLVEQRDFSSLPDHIFGYWLSKNAIRVFATESKIISFGQARRGLQTGNAPRFIRIWHEPALSRTLLASLPRQDCIRAAKRWFLFSNGGEFRKWYGNVDFVVNWESGGHDIKATGKAIIPSERRYFEEGITWSRLGGGRTAFRYVRQGIIPGDTGPTIYAEGSKRELLGYLNTVVCEHFLRVLVPSMTFLTGDIENLPYRAPPGDLAARIGGIVDECISVACTDWDSFETSCDFGELPLLRAGIKGTTLAQSWETWAECCRHSIVRMQELETENNRLWIDAYGLQGELTPEVPEEGITLARPDRRKDVAAFLSYAVGCMMGRYSLDQPGLILADAGDTLGNYLPKVGRPPDRVTFSPDADGIIPVLDGEWFEDDIVARTRAFLRVTFGEGTLEQNLRFIEESLGRDLRRYFLSDFYKDHLQTYKRRPIYWMFQSPKKGFNALIYLHRYTRDTVNGVLNRYLREFLHKLRSRIQHLDHVLDSESTSGRDKTKARKESDQLRKNLRECEEYEREVLLPLAQRRVELDLDDGVKVNYLRLGAALAPIPGLVAREEE
jgi:SAM-dependent methyltransferase